MKKMCVILLSLFISFVSFAEIKDERLINTLDEILKDYPHSSNIKIYNDAKDIIFSKEMYEEKLNESKNKYDYFKNNLNNIKTRIDKNWYIKKEGRNFAFLEKNDNNEKLYYSINNEENFEILHTIKKELHLDRQLKIESNGYELKETIIEPIGSWSYDTFGANKLGFVYRALFKYYFYHDNGRIALRTIAEFYIFDNLNKIEDYDFNFIDILHPEGYLILEHRKIKHKRQYKTLVFQYRILNTETFDDKGKEINIDKFLQKKGNKGNFLNKEKIMIEFIKEMNGYNYQ